MSRLMNQSDQTSKKSESASSKWSEYTNQLTENVIKDGSSRKRKFDLDVSEDTSSDSTEIILKRDSSPYSEVVDEDNKNSTRNLYGLKPQYLKSLGITCPLDCWLHVKNFRCDKSDLKEVLELAGHVVVCAMVPLRDRYARVMYSHPLEAVQAISMLNGQTFYGQKLQIAMISSPSDTYFVPKGLTTMGPGFGINGKPLRDIVKQYKIFKKNRQGTEIDTSLFNQPDSDGGTVKSESINENSRNSNPNSPWTRITSFKIMSVEEFKDVDENSVGITSKKSKLDTHTKAVGSPSIKNSREISDDLTSQSSDEEETMPKDSRLRTSFKPNVALESIKSSSPFSAASTSPDNVSKISDRSRVMPFISPISKPQVVKPISDTSVSSRGNLITVHNPNSNTISGNHPPRLPGGNMNLVRPEMTNGGCVFGPIGSNVPQPVMRPRLPNIAMTPTRFSPGPLVDPRIGRNGPNIGPSGPNIGPSGPNIGPSGPNIGPSGPNMSPIGTNMGPGGPNLRPNVPYMRSNVSNMSPNVPNMAANVSNMGPNVPNMAPKVHNMGPGPIVQNMGPNVPNMGQYQGMPQTGPMTGPSTFSLEFRNLPPSTTFPLLCEKVAQCGQVLSLQLTTPGCAIARFAQRDQARACFRCIWILPKPKEPKATSPAVVHLPFNGRGSGEYNSSR